MDDALNALVRQHDQENLKNSLVVLVKLGICQYKNMVVTPGPNSFAENERWLTHEFLVDMLCIEPGDVDETDDGSHRQCDSCKREQSGATHGRAARTFSTVEKYSRLT